MSKLDELSLLEENFASIIHDMQSIINLWSAKSLTLLGKITVLNTLINSKIIYKASYLSMHLPEAQLRIYKSTNSSKTQRRK